MTCSVPARSSKAATNGCEVADVFDSRNQMMAIKEYWIQIENRNWNSASKSGDRSDDSGRLYSPETETAIDLATLPLETCSASRSYAPGEGDTDCGEWSTGDTLFLRCYRPPEQEDKSDAWAVPEEPETAPAECHETSPSERDFPGPSPGPTIECHIGDRVIVHFRNNDQRHRVVTKMIEVDVPCGGPVKLPIPFSEPFPIEDRTHSLRPQPFECCTVQDASTSLPLFNPLQPVGAEARLWQQVGVTAFKTGNRVPPGATFTYRWEVLGRSDSRVFRPLRRARFVIGGISALLCPGCG